jgi:hypothetical protein
MRLESAVPPGLRPDMEAAHPTLKRGANNHCAYGAGLWVLWESSYSVQSVQPLRPADG